ncbi:type VII secretion target [Streptantibioticus rubrisoli]|uniref:Type VII secretion target n=1 Tax=Streptantibioticus rubrisoli TaxID=1387313 RepID=A0ABT1PJE4_9ACTN|nr:type VII secretion target [Streptantibioticus rubrisoli]MCQ4044368.1 type VII secretion target [Streptantibioticus rubrisoli]
MTDTPDIGINTAGVAKAGGDVGALADAANKHVSHAVDASYDVGDSQWGWQSGTYLNVCARTWEDHMVDLVNRVGQTAKDLSDAAKAYDVTDAEAARRMRLALGDLGKG